MLAPWTQISIGCEACHGRSAPQARNFLAAENDNISAGVKTQEQWLQSSPRAPSGIFIKKAALF
jgi:hypothetical protein